MADKSFWNDPKDKNWWSNFWYYYKKHIFGALFLVIFITVGVTECVRTVYPDLTVCYIGDFFFSDQTVAEIEDAFLPSISDADGKNGTVVQFKQINVASGEQMIQAAMLELSAGETYLYILPQSTFEAYVQQGVFEDVSHLLGQPSPVYGVPLENSKLFQSYAGLQKHPLYAGVRVMTNAKASKPKEQAKQQNAKQLLLDLSKE